MTPLPTQIINEYIVNIDGIYMRVLYTYFGNYYLVDTSDTIRALAREVAEQLISTEPKFY